MGMVLQPLSFAEAREFVSQHHRHHRPPVGHKFSIGLSQDEEMVGVIIVGRPVARGFDDGWTAEVTRCCVREGFKNACSRLYAAAWRACRAMGYTRLVTYTLAAERGTSLVAAGWTEVYTTRDRPKGWNTPSRPRAIVSPTGQKTLWEVTSHA